MGKGVCVLGRNTGGWQEREGAGSHRELLSNSGRLSPPPRGHPLLSPEVAARVECVPGLGRAENMCSLVTTLCRNTGEVSGGAEVAWAWLGGRTPSCPHLQPCLPQPTLGSQLRPTWGPGWFRLPCLPAGDPPLGLGCLAQVDLCDLQGEPGGQVGRAGMRMDQG